MTIIDIGGQGIRIVELDDMGVMQNFRTNDKCSTGTGCFLETMSIALDIAHDDMGEVGLTAKSPCRIHSICTVFAESEIISLLARGAVPLCHSGRQPGRRGRAGPGPRGGGRERGPDAR